LVHLRLELAGAYFDIEFSRDRVSPSNPHQLIVNMVVFGVFFTLIAFIYLRNQLRPITRLAAAAEAFGRGRTLPYHPSGAIEVRAAGRAFLDMRARIERHIEQRTMILSGVSHDLRTPLTRLKLGLSMLEHDDRKLLERDVDEMRQLLDEFLSFAREQGDEGGKSEATNPFELVQMIVQDTTRAGHSVSLRCNPSTILVEMRPLAIKRALENLIMNAVRYGTKAVVDLQYDARSLVISVEDDGPSIPPELYEEAMKPFSRLDPARNQNKGSGVGLGLPIAADIARAHGGRVELSKSRDFGGLCASLIISR
jgi:two-component system osmolarity sensor histidine kinase EnvZ